MLRARDRQPRGGNTRKRPLSASATLLTLAGVAAGLLVLTAAMVTLLEQPERHSRQQFEAAQRVALVARGVALRVNDMRDALSAIAASGPLVAALRGGDRERLNDLAALYRTTFPEALRLLIVPGELRPDPAASPPIGYALLEQLERSRDSGRVNIEVHRPGHPDSHFNLVAPVAGDTAAALVLSAPLDVLAEAASPGDGAQARLLQSTGAGDTEILSVGDAGSASVYATLGVESTPWRLEYRLARPAGGLAGLDPIRLLSILAAAMLILAVVTWLLRSRLVTALVADGRAIERLATALRSNRPGPAVSARVAELDAGFHAAASPTPAPSVVADDPAADTPHESSQAAPAEGWDSGLEVTELDANADEATKAFNAPPSTAADEGNDASIDASVFRAYDIRGVVGTTLTTSAVRAIGQAIGSEAAELGQRDIVVGYDGRHSSPELAAALREGLMSTGANVIDLGRVPTPVVYFAAHQFGTQAGVMVTGSHNPPEYNGLKTVLGGRALWGEGIQALRGRIEDGRLLTGRGSERRLDPVPEYLDRIASDITLHRALRVVVDCGNGVPGAVAPVLLRAIGCEVEELYCEVDGDFPNHHPDPTVPENLEALIHYVRLQDADLGIALDGDGDRLGIVDDQGHIIWADRQMMLFARDILGRNPGTDIIFDVKCTSLLADVITENAGVPVMWKTGHSMIKEKLRDSGALLAGEMSGHIFFVERWYGFDDGLYAAARLLEILSMDPRPASEVFAELPEGNSTPEIRVDLAEGEPPKLMERLLATASELPQARTTTIDGLRLDFPDGWGLVRASNTQPALVLRFEGVDADALARIQALFRERLLAIDPDLKLPF